MRRGSNNICKCNLRKSLSRILYENLYTTLSLDCYILVIVDMTIRKRNTPIHLQVSRLNLKYSHND